MNVRFLPAAALLLHCTAPLLAQTPQIVDVWPPGVRSGTTATLQLEGANLQNATSILVSGKGVIATLGRTPGASAASITIAADPAAAPGPRELRVVTPMGVSNAGFIWIGGLPVRAVAKPGLTVQAALPIPRSPTALCAKISAPQQIHWYQVTVHKGEWLVCDVCAERIYSRLNPYIEIQDEAGHLLDSARSVYHRDAQLIHHFAAAGKYLLQVRDLLYNGEPGAVYQLTAGEIPCVTRLFPPGGTPGQSFTAQPAGANLGAAPTFTVHIPADASVDHDCYVIEQTQNGNTLPIPISVTPFTPVSRAPGTAPMALNTLPVTVNAIIGTPHQADWYLLTAPDTRPVGLDVLARRAGSMLNVCVRILSGSKVLVNTEDSPLADPQITFMPPAAGRYRVEISSLDSESGPGYFYQLSIRPATSMGLALTATPDVINLQRGQTSLVDVTAQRLGGFTGPIKVEVTGLPAGCTVTPLTLAPGQTSGFVTVTAATAAPVSAAQILVLGTAMVGTAMVSAAASARTTLPPTSDGQPQSRSAAFQMASVNPTTPLFALSEEAGTINLAAGQSVLVKVHAARTPGNAGAQAAIQLIVERLPTGVTAEAPAIPDKQADATIKLTAAPTAAPTSQPVLVSGKLGDNVQRAPAVILTVTPQPPTKPKPH